MLSDFVAGTCRNDSRIVCHVRDFVAGTYRSDMSPHLPDHHITTVDAFRGHELIEFGLKRRNIELHKWL